ncbi:Smr/MutS family protein [Albirhodobacter sp. R86504]|jgi:DNA-nicking Smr family endonuclease|uniref:Smr/MutS family protein n=1 Tax=Albirhodobacter sp. R86504 TaxID=3093848 RepID=UPI00366E6DBD
MKRRRKLSAEERELWSRVAATTQPVRPPKADEREAFVAGLNPPKAEAPLSKKTQSVPAIVPSLKDLRIGTAAPSKRLRLDLAPSVADHLAAQPVQMDRKKHQKMTRGRIEPESKIDLHGMTVNEAHPELIRFILNAQDRGCRLVLVITGKGKMADDYGPIPVRRGILRHQVPQWLRLPPLGQAVLQVTQAHLKHGGGGAYYVYLRRR